jgi:site-specific DNA recombinase
MVFAEHERKLISKRTREKAVMARQQGRWTGGLVPLGYDLAPEGGKITVNPGEAQIVREVFALYQLHRSLLAVARIARERGWQTKAWRTREGVWRQGKLFTKPDVHRLLLNPLYMGMVLCHGELYPGQHEALVTPATFDRVQGMLEEGSRTGGAPGKNTCEALLRGLLRCGACGEAMIHEQAKRGPRLHRYYVCTGAQKRGAEACPSRRMPAQELEAFVIEHLRAIMQNDGVRADVVAEALAYQTAHAAAAAEEAGHLRTERQRLKEGNTRLLGQLADGDTDGAAASIRGQIASAEETIAALSRRLRALATEQAVLASVTVDGDQVGQALASFDRIWDVLEPRERERLVRLCLDHVEVDRHAGTLRLHLHPLGLRALGDEFGGPAAIKE